MAHSLPRLDEAPVAATTSVGDGDIVSRAGSGNVFADLGFDSPAEEQVKADIVIGIADEIARRGLSQTVAAELMGIGQPDLSGLLRGRTGGHSLERLLGFARALGSDVEITIRRSEAASPKAGGLSLRLGESA